MKPKIKFDEYELRARLFPAVIVTLPAIAAVYALFSSARSILGIATGTIVESAFLFLLARIARDRGKRIQEQLYSKWGGKTTTVMLRHRDTHLDPFTKERYKRTLSSLSNLSFPTQEQELADPARADQIYESAVRALIEKRRGKTYHLVFAENCNFGFVRNLLGLKSIGIFISVVIFILVGFLIRQRRWDAPSFWWIAAAVSVAVMLLLLLITEAAARRTAEAYSEALLRTCEPSQRTPKLGSPVGSARRGQDSAQN